MGGWGLIQSWEIYPEIQHNSLGQGSDLTTTWYRVQIDMTTVESG